MEWVKKKILFGKNRCKKRSYPDQKKFRYLMNSSFKCYHIHLVISDCVIFSDKQFRLLIRKRKGLTRPLGLSY